MSRGADIQRARDAAGEWLTVGCLAEAEVGAWRRVQGLYRGQHGVQVKLGGVTAGFTWHAAKTLRLAQSTICDRCAEDFALAEAMSCEGCGGTFDPDCFHEHECVG